MVYIKLFNTEQEKQACTDTYEYLSYTVESDKVNIHPYDYSQDYLTFVALESGTFQFDGLSNTSVTNEISYSIDNGATWSTPSSSVTVNVQSGDKVLWKGNMTPISTNPSQPWNSLEGIGRFSGGTASFNVEGNPLSLIYNDELYNQTIPISAYTYLFSSSKVVNAKNLSLPSITLANNCYRQMFQGCTSLTTAPELLATTLAERCYYYMFSDCTSLAYAPQLQATTLARGCYEGMFNGCISLTTPPKLSATTLADYCCCGMFQDCINLTTAPELPATTLVNYCYLLMFSGCTSLTTAPELPATTLVYACYNGMFQGCTNLNYIKMLATNISESNCLTNWVYGVAASGTFVKDASMTTLPSGVSGIPNGWTVQDA